MWPEMPHIFATTSFALKTCVFIFRRNVNNSPILADRPLWDGLFSQEHCLFGSYTLNKMKALEHTTWCVLEANTVHSPRTTCRRTSDQMLDDAVTRALSPSLHRTQRTCSFANHKISEIMRSTFFLSSASFCSALSTLIICQ